MPKSQLHGVPKRSSCGCSSKLWVLILPACLLSLSSPGNCLGMAAASCRNHLHAASIVSFFAFSFFRCLFNKLLTLNSLFKNAFGFCLTERSPFRFGSMNEGSYQRTLAQAPGSRLLVVQESGRKGSGMDFRELDFCEYTLSLLFGVGDVVFFSFTMCKVCCIHYLI